MITWVHRARQMPRPPKQKAASRRPSLPLAVQSSAGHAAAAAMQALIQPRPQPQAPVRPLQAAFVKGVADLARCDLGDRESAGVHVGGAALAFRSGSALFSCSFSLEVSS